MTYVMRMSTDSDIINATLDQAWNPVNGDYQWQAIQAAGHGGQPTLGVPNNEAIVVIAHGNNTEIGNSQPGAVDIPAEAFLVLIQSHIMAANARPATIFISACAKNIAGFAAAVALVAEENRIWRCTLIYGHTDAVSGNVPPPPLSGSLDWTVIYVGSEVP